jgi:hypothetical protein
VTKRVSAALVKLFSRAAITKARNWPISILIFLPDNPTL